LICPRNHGARDNFSAQRIEKPPNDGRNNPESTVMQTPDIRQCPDCGGPMQLVYFKRRAMLGCCRYPDCKGIRQISSQQAKEIERMPRVSSFYATHYRTGDEVRAGDRISWAGYPGYVVLAWECETLRPTSPRRITGRARKASCWTYKAPGLFSSLKATRIWTL
jgi:ssDNA-binding Zn-finger/Zn-ribbon topoisomerase 1